MTRLVVVEQGYTEVISSGPQFGVPYVLIGPDGTRATFNDPSDADYVGWLTNITGMDSPDVRESASDLVHEDGGVHGTFYYGRRPVVVEGQIDNRPTGPLLGREPNVVRNVRATRLQRSTNAMRNNGVMRWTPDGGIEQYIEYRRQQPLRISGAFNKTFQAALVAADPRIYSAALREVRISAANTDVQVANLGTAGSSPTITLQGPVTNPTLRNMSTGGVITLNVTLGAGDFLVVDLANRTVLLNNATSVYAAVDFLATQWWEIAPGSNNIRWTGTGTTGATNALVRWRDAWI